MRRRALGILGLRLLGAASVLAVLAIYWADRGTMGWDNLKDALKSAGILAGLASAELTCLMVLLASRIPFVDRLTGHDRAIARHSGLGSWVVGAIAAHGVLLTWSYAMSARTGFWNEFTQLWSWQDYALAVISFGLLLAVGFTSALLSIRKHLSHELWHAIHLTTYLAIAISIPHQFSMDSLFDSTWARWTWIGLYGTTAACLVAFRVVLPVVRSLRHQLVVTEVAPAGDGLVAITMTGRHLATMPVAGGQFLNWRFLTPGLAWQSHPFSLSQAPDGRRLRITVKQVGRASESMARLAPGTRVLVEGPYGRFTDAARTRNAVVLAGAGSGIAPLLGLLQSTPTAPGRALVVLRASTRDEIPHLAEFGELCRERGVQLVTLLGARGEGWTPAGQSVALAALAPWLCDADLYLCGPGAWTAAVETEAREAGLPAGQLHTESFSL